MYQLQVSRYTDKTACIWNPNDNSNGTAGKEGASVNLEYIYENIFDNE